VPKDNIVAIELSEYAGYAGVHRAKGGMEPNEPSRVFFQKYGFKVKLTVARRELARAEQRPTRRVGDHVRWCSPTSQSVTGGSRFFARVSTRSAEAEADRSAPRLSIRSQIAHDYVDGIEADAIAFVRGATPCFPRSCLILHAIRRN